ncbi:transmembrane channel-like protein 7 isoform X4 [Scyliorhinus canicula]|uniref:transmembrane channel-like protein 7 isoform X4 n=1 Tax=Scyliorhinus canicula TaxID=7830 RepID=UPI0018F28E49|nr:transmembrane channel-like protein 7 isoform X4 [Scyliorhinus canicula]
MEQMAVYGADVESDRDSLSNVSLQPYHQTGIFQELPSYKTVRRRTKCLSSKNEQRFSIQDSGNEISNLQFISEEQLLFEDRKQSLRELPVSLTEKREMSDKRKYNSGSLSSWETWKQSQQKLLKKLKEEASHAISWLELWKGSLGEIEGRYGNGIQSYFTFLRFLVFLNLFAFLLVGGFVLLPSIYISKMKLNQTVAEQPQNTSECFKYDPYHHGLVPFYAYILDLFSGTGFMEASYMFYGYYTFDGNQISNYNLPLAYLLTMVLYFLFCLCWILKRIVNGFKQECMQEASYSTRHSAKIFSLWDFCIKAPMMAILKQQSIVNDLKIDLQEQRCRRMKAERSTKDKVFLYSIRVVLNLFIMLLLTGAFYCIYQATKSSQQFQQKGNGSGKIYFLFEFFMEYLPPIVISVSNILLPFLFRIIVRYEEYPPNTEINLILIRFVAEHGPVGLTKMLQKQQFMVPENVLDIVDGQTIVWIGMFYSPLLPLLNIVKHFITFYVKKHSLYNYCRPGKRLFRLSSSKIFFQLILLFGLVVAIVPIMVNVTLVHPSIPCGPFRQHKTAWEIIPKLVSTLPSEVQIFLKYITSEPFILLLITVLCTVLTILVSLVQTNRSTITQLKQHLILAGKDKRYLVKKLSTHSQQPSVGAFQDSFSESVKDVNSRA